jgi:hypothetical protein
MMYQTWQSVKVSDKKHKRAGAVGSVINEAEKGGVLFIEVKFDDGTESIEASKLEGM